MSSASVYSTFLGALNGQDLASAAQVVDVQRYREDCVGFTGDFVSWDVRVEDKLIVERVQQADVLGQMRQLYGKAFGLVGLGAFSGACEASSAATTMRLTWSRLRSGHPR